MVVGYLSKLTGPKIVASPERYFEHLKEDICKGEVGELTSQSLWCPTHVSKAAEGIYIKKNNEYDRSPTEWPKKR